MKFVYKINSGYDGFQPSKIPQRLDGQSLKLGWHRYVDAVELGDEVLVFFRGPHRFVDGVYARGIAERVDYDAGNVWLRVTEHTVDHPLTDPARSVELAAVVATRYQQVFVLPEELDTPAECTMAQTASSCAAKICGSCRFWKQLPIIDRRNLVTPKRLAGHVESFAPGFWSIPARSYLYARGHTIRPGICRTSEMFYRFKTGEERLAFPLALAAYKSLAKAQRLDFDAIVPVPLSPDKSKAGELHRTLALAKELGALMTVPVRQWLELSRPVSKKRLRIQHGMSASAFEAHYLDALTVSSSAMGSSILIVDDVCTEGSTLRACARALAAPGRNLVATTGAQMAVKQAVRLPEALWQS